MQEFRMTSAVGAMYICGLIAVGIWAIPFYQGISGEEPASSIFYVAMFTILVIIIAFVAAGLVDARISVITIDHEKITLKSLLSNRELYFDEIKGWREIKGGLALDSAVKGKKNMLVSVYFNNSKELFDFIKVRFTDLDNVKKQKAINSVLENDAYGKTRQTRNQTLKRGHIFAIIYNCIGAGVIPGLMFLGGVYDYNIFPYIQFACMLIPVTGIAVTLFSKSLIRITFDKDSAFSNIMIGTIVPCVLLIAFVMFSINLLDYVSAWVFAVSIAVVLSMVVLIGNIRYRSINCLRYVDSLLTFFFLCMYGYGVVLNINYEYDTSEPEVYQVRVLDKYISTGKSTTYHLNLTSWEKHPEPDEVTVSFEKYNSINKDDKINVYLYQGQLNIPWYIVSVE